MRSDFRKLKILFFIGSQLLSYEALSQHFQAGWGTKFEDGERKVKIGARIQGIMESDSETESQDAYLRRTRLNIVFQPWAHNELVYDIRNDNSNRDDRGDGKFVIGDGYWRILTGHPIFSDIRLFRAKVDVSYAQTSSSKNLLVPNRATPAEEAASFVVQNRRATNAQVNGSIGDLRFQLVLSDGVSSEDIESLYGSVTVDKVNHQKLTYGGKLRYYFWGDAHKNYVQDTFYGNYDTFSIGAGYFANDKINVALSDGNELSFRRDLFNVELSFSLEGARLLSEHFWFDGTIYDLDSPGGKIGKSKGHYAHAEYVIGKVAPFVGYEWFDRWSDETGYVEEGTLAGINYYENFEASRYGLAYKKSIYGSKLDQVQNEKIYTYIMLNF